MDSESTLSSDRDQMDLLRIPIFLFLLIILTFVLRRAWMADDAYITLRSVDNWMHGFGPVFNPGYRVQAYTHPLWMLVLAGFYMLTHEASYTTIAINLALTAFMLGWMVRFSRKDLGMLIALLLLGFSSSFIDYSTSGLENTLSHALIVVFITLYTTALAEQRRVGWAALCGGLLVLNRLDLSLIVFPALASGLWKWRSWFAVKWLVLGLSPVLAWEIFSIIYYGMPFPNTYYAKLNAGIPNVEMIRQGIVYIFATLRNDPITLAGIGMGTVLPLIMRRKELYPLILGILFYLGYILWIGGDFMEGRFLSVPLVSAAMIISMTWSGPHNTWVAALAGAIILLGLSGPHPTYRSLEPLTDQDQLFGLMNERLYYASTNTLTAIGRRMNLPTHDLRYAAYQRDEPPRYAVLYAVGMASYYAGPEYFIFDHMALGDPLLSRLPAKVNPEWRIGHYERLIPDGYIDTVIQKKPLIVDKALQMFYDKLRMITTGPLFARDRWQAIVELNTGQLNDLIDPIYYRSPDRMTADQSSVSNPRERGTKFDEPGNIVFGPAGLEINLDKTWTSPRLSISLDNNDDYLIMFFKGNQTAGEIFVSAAYGGSGLVVYNLSVPEKAQKMGYNRLLILPRAGDNMYSLGHVIPTD